MGVTEITQLVGSLGFPIVACAALFWYMNKQRESHKEEMDSMKSAVAGMQTAVENNTNILLKLYEKLGGRTGE